METPHCLNTRKVKRFRTDKEWSWSSFQKQLKREVRCTRPLAHRSNHPTRTAWTGRDWSRLGRRIDRCWCWSWGQLTRLSIKHVDNLEANEDELLRWVPKTWHLVWPLGGCNYITCDKLDEKGRSRRGRGWFRWRVTVQIKRAIMKNSTMSFVTCVTWLKVPHGSQPVLTEPSESEIVWLSKNRLVTSLGRAFVYCKKSRIWKFQQFGGSAVHGSNFCECTSTVPPATKAQWKS